MDAEAAKAMTIHIMVTMWDDIGIYRQLPADGRRDARRRFVRSIKFLLKCYHEYIYPNEHEDILREIYNYYVLRRSRGERVDYRHIMRTLEDYFFELDFQETREFMEGAASGWR